MTTAPRAARPPSLKRSVARYAAVLLAGSALFFALHYAGNTISYDLALERVTTEITSDRPDLGHASGISALLDYCHRASVILAAAKPLPGDNSLVDAILPRLIVTDRPGNHCDAIRRVSVSGVLDKSGLILRYWWGSAALYALAMRFLSDADIREWTRIFTILAWGLLALPLWFFSRKAFLAIVPLGIFAAFFSGLPYFSDAATGFPFLLAPLSGAALALALRRSHAAARLCCFVIGMASSYLWLFDGHNLLIVVLIGLIAYFGSVGLSAPQRAAAGARLIGLYAAGFVLCHAVGQLVKAAVGQLAGVEWASAERVFSGFFTQFSARNDRLSDTLTQAFAENWTGIPIIRDFTPYWIIGPDRVALGQTVTLLSALAFAVSLVFAAAMFAQKRKSLLTDMTLIGALAAVAGLQFILPDDLPYRSPRYLFIWHALCWSGFLLASREAFALWKESPAPAGSGAPASARGNRRSRRAAGRRVPGSSPRPRLRIPKDAALRAFLAMTAVAVVAGAWFGASLLRADAAFARETVQETQPRISGRSTSITTRASWSTRRRNATSTTRRRVSTSISSPST